MEGGAGRLSVAGAAMNRKVATLKVTLRWVKMKVDPEKMKEARVKMRSARLKVNVDGLIMWITPMKMSAESVKVTVDSGR